MNKSITEVENYSQLRRFIAVSIKHSAYEKKKNRFWLWGYQRTKDNESRCFADYVSNPDKCELYALTDWKGKYVNCEWMKVDEPVTFRGKTLSRVLNEFKDFDTVLVDENEYKEWMDVN